MKKLLLILALTLISTHTMAEWTEIGKNDEDGYTLYVDKTTIRKSSSKVKMWTLLDYKNEQRASGVNFSSKSIRRDYDCKGKHMKTLAFKLFGWNMEQGPLVRSYNQPRNWEIIEPESLDDIEWQIACGQ